MRDILVLIFAGILILGLACVLFGANGAWSIVLWSAFLLAAMLVENWRYRSAMAEEADDWEDTGESFIDPESNLPHKVMYSQKTGARKYVLSE